MDEKEIKVTGERVFESGAKRDPNTNKGRYDLLSPLFMQRLAVHTQNGGKARGDRNWETGMPMDAVIDSAIRHLFNYLEGDRSEDHLAAAAWNVMNLIHVEEQIDRGNLPKSLADGLPDYTVKITPIPYDDVYAPLPLVTWPSTAFRYITPDIDPLGPYDAETGKPYENWDKQIPAEVVRSCSNCLHGGPYSDRSVSGTCYGCRRLSNWLVGHETWNVTQAEEVEK